MILGIIGAGASGLCVAHHALNAGLTPIIWEQASDVGGTWRLSDKVGVDDHGLPVHSSIYENLQCDLPKVMMAFPDFAFSEDGDDFAHHTVVLKYLENYAEHYNVKPCIKFGHFVENVRPILKEGGKPSTWEVVVKNLVDGTTGTTICDALLVCNGHFSVPSYPDIPDIDNFIGKKIHSHDYRNAEPYVGQKVLVLGGGPSGLDIALEVSSVAKLVYLGHNFPVLIPSEFPSNLHQVASVKSTLYKGFHLNDGKFVEVDSIIYCTGYKYNFPFLSEECRIIVENSVVKPLYKHMINALHPTMGFIGVPSHVAVFPLIDYQARFFLATLTGKAGLPSSEEMLSEIELDLKHLNMKGRKDKEYHRLQGDQWEYVEDLAKRAGIDPPAEFRKKLFTIIIARIFLSYPIFKTYSYRLRGNNILEYFNGEVLNTGLDLTLLTLKQLVRLLFRDFFRVIWFLCSVFTKTFSGLLKK